MQFKSVQLFRGLFLCGLTLLGACRSETPAPKPAAAASTPVVASAPVFVASAPVAPTPPMPAANPAPANPFNVAPVAVTITKPLDTLVWDAILKESTPLPGQPTADFIFKVSNPTESDVVITDVHTSCGCTVAQLPSKPWVLMPHTNGEISVKVNLAGKSGTFFKTVTIYSTNDTKLLTIKVNLPESPAMVRMRNQQLAAVDPQAVFKGDCRKCHFDTAKGTDGAPLMGKPLYVAVCGICHEAKPRATMVADLHNLKHPTDSAFWKQIIADGKPKTMMPGFALAHDGPLTDEQIESLAKVMTQEFPSPALPPGGVPTATPTGAVPQ